MKPNRIINEPEFKYAGEIIKLLSHVSEFVLNQGYPRYYFNIEVELPNGKWFQRLFAIGPKFKTNIEAIPLNTPFKIEYVKDVQFDIVLTDGFRRRIS